MARTGTAPLKIVSDRGLEQVTDEGALESAVAAVMEKNPKEVAAYRSGKTKLLGFFVGQVMRETRGKANPKMVNDILKAKLGA